MIDSIFIALYIVAVIIWILGIERKTLTYTGISFILFLILWAQSIYIEVPFIAVTSSSDYTTGTQQHLDPAVGASCWAFIIIDLLIFIYYFLGWWRRRRGEEPALP